MQGNRLMVRLVVAAWAGLCVGLSSAVAAGELARPSYTAMPSIELGLQVAGERHLFWTLPDYFSPSANYATRRHWGELYVKPGVKLGQRLDGGVSVYAEVSAVGSATLAKDPFEAGNTGRLSLESAVAGLRFSQSGGDAQAQPQRLDLSFGAQPYAVGTGMLIANGGSNGFVRGALKLGPRKAWAQSAIARWHSGPLQGELFHLVPNEQPDGDSGTRLAGAVLSYQPEPGRQLGLSWGRVTASNAPYPQAAPGGEGAPQIIEGGRGGLSFLYGFARWPVRADVLPGLWLGADLALQRHRRLDMRAWGARIEAGLDWAQLPWRPQLVLGLQSLSGDDPDTARLERFDPLYYEGSPGAWASGSKASMVYINSNVRALQIRLVLHPSPRDIVTVYLAHLRANELRSPLQFGQATRPQSANGAPSLVAGVLQAHLADDAFVKYTRVLNPNTYLTLGVSASFPGEGMQRLLGGNAKTWTGWIANVVWAY